MKKALVLIAILLFPSLVYLYFSLGSVKYARVPFFGPRYANGKLNAKGKPDTTYYSVPSFSFEDYKRNHVDSRSLTGKIHAVSFITRDSLHRRLGELSAEVRIKGDLWRGIQFVFFLELQDKDSGQAVLPNVGKEIGIPDSMTTSFYCSAAQLDSVRKAYFVSRNQDDKRIWKGYDLFVLIDKNDHIRGYYDPKAVRDLKMMSEDFKHIILHDEAVETIESQKIEQRKN